MNCDEAQSWLLASHDERGLPEPVAAHLRGCLRCRRSWGLLRGIDASLSALPVPVGSRSACAAFLRNSFRPKAGASRLPVAWLGRAAAAVLLVGGALGLWLATGPRPLNPARTVAPRAGEAAIEQLFARNLLLANSDDPGARVRLLAATADDLAAQAVSRAGRQALDGLPLVVDLYGIASEGLATAARSLPEGQKGKVLEEIAEHLRRHGELAAQAAAGLLPAFAERLLELARAAEEAKAALAGGPMPARRAAPATGRPDDPESRLAVLVGQAVRLAGDPSPEGRAESCAQVVDHWSQAVLFAAVRGEEEQAERLGEQMGEMIDKGVAPNAEKAPGKAHLFGKRSAQAKGILERNLAQAPQAAKAGLQRALRASGRGWKDGLPPGLRDRPGQGVPPGLKDRGKGKGKGKGKNPRDTPPDGKP